MTKKSNRFSPEVREHAVQDRIDPQPCSLEDEGVTRTGHPGMGVLIQSPPTNGADWAYSTGRC